MTGTGQGADCLRKGWKVLGKGFFCSFVVFFLGRTRIELNVMDVGVIMEFWHPASLMQISELIKVSIPSLWWPWDELGKPSCFRNKGVRD